ncbi:MAG TPA: hypothetical protein PK252_05790 [Bacteroidales bacterium]|nr:hypothetical protein [Bacteroidales bacterium]
MKHRWVVICMFLFLPSFAYKGICSLTPSSLSNEINTLLDSIKNIPGDSLRKNVNDKVISILDKYFRQATSFNDSLIGMKYIGKIFSPDKKFNIITWNLPMQDGTNTFYGFIQINPKKDSVCKVYFLKNNNLFDPKALPYVKTNTDRWIGALYYEIVPPLNKKNDTYILLGSQLNNMFTSKKIIETMTIDEDNIVFGSPVIYIGQKPQCRIIFEFAISAKMSLQYIADKQMIVFDHLSPVSPVYVGNYKFYGPDFTYDGLKYEKDRWNYVSDIFLRNKK